MNLLNRFLVGVGLLSWVADKRMDGWRMEG